LTSLDNMSGHFGARSAAERILRPEPANIVASRGGLVGTALVRNAASIVIVPGPSLAWAALVRGRSVSFLWSTDGETAFLFGEEECIIVAIGFLSRLQITAEVGAVPSVTIIAGRSRDVSSVWYA